MNQKDREGETRTAKVEFRPKGTAEPAITMTLSGVAAEIHKSPEKLRALMEMLDLPEGTTATVTVQVSSTVVR
jgi:hypothetical protein